MLNKNPIDDHFYTFVLGIGVACESSYIRLVNTSETRQKYRCPTILVSSRQQEISIDV
jgi:hypothetical protein